MRELCHPEYSYTGADGQRHDGPEAHLAMAQMFATAVPNARIEIRSVYTAGDIVIVEFTGRGTHQGELLGIAPTRRQITMPVCTVIELRAGKIYAEREYMDRAHMMQQLGITSTPATA